MLEHQNRVNFWLIKCLGDAATTDKKERCYRFIEEALELVQACNLIKEEVIQMVEYTFNRPAGEVKQEVAGVMVTLAALCNATGINMEKTMEEELTRVSSTQAMEKIRIKNKDKPHPIVLKGTGIREVGRYGPFNISKRDEMKKDL